MEKPMTVQEVSKLWGISERRINGMCKDGSIAGAYKQGRSWLIPYKTEKPVDQRIKTGRYIKKPQKLPLPIGVSDYRKASTEYYYVDKTLMIRDFLDERPMVSLFTRPRRFGKTLNMDMLRTFFEKTDEDTSVFFKDMKIWRCGERYRKEQGMYPVIFISFKDVKYDTWEDTIRKITELLGYEFARHAELASSSNCTEIDRLYYANVIAQKADATTLSGALSVLSRMLHAHHQVAPVIIIDEYDTPIQQGHVKDFYDQVIQFMRNLFSGGLKDNPHLTYGFLTGILRVAKESIFSGLNNLAINSIMDDRYSKYFGFVPEEVQEMAKYYGMSDRFNEICEWYDGYQFGSSEIFNPWSVINYFRNGGQAAAYWQSTGSNDIIGEILHQADQETYEHLTSLLQGDSFATLIDTSVIYPQIRKNPSSIYSFLLVAGYLKTGHTDRSFTGEEVSIVSIPNREISMVYKKEILDQIAIMPRNTTISIQESLYTGNVPALQRYLEKLLLESASYYDAVGEIYYQGLLLGLCAVMDTRYRVTSNQESGDGRYDIQLAPRSRGLPGILIELKADKRAGQEHLSNLAQNALEQINANAYTTSLAAQGVEHVIKYGVAFSGKHVSIAVENSILPAF